MHEVLRDILAKTGYETMLKADTSPEAESRLANLLELVNAAAEAAERGETVAEFLDHAALIADSDALDEQAQVSLLTVHNAKGLEFPNVFVAGLEEGIFPHSRSFNGEPAMEEERRLCYVAMTRAEKRLYFTWARYRRRYGGGQPEVCLPSRFLNEVPTNLREKLSNQRNSFGEEVNLYGEQHEVRESAKKNLYTGRTYNSVENIAQFFAERGMPLPAGLTKRPTPAPATPPVPAQEARPAAVQPSARATQPSIPSRQSSQMSFAETSGLPVAATAPQARARSKMTVSQSALPVGAVINHPKYGRGKILRREGDGEDAKLTISFPGYGLKKIVEKYVGIRVNE